MSAFYAEETPAAVRNAKGLHLISTLSPNGRKAHIYLEELKDKYGLEWTTSLIDLDTAEQKKPWYLKLNPNGRIPILIDNTQSPPHVVFESSAILLYLLSSVDKDHIFGFSDPIEQSQLTQWLIFWHASGQPIQGQYNYFRRNAIDESPHAAQRFKNEVLRIYNVLEIHLSGKYTDSPREYLAGAGKGKYSIADINAWGWLRTFRSIDLGEDDLAKLPHLAAWVDRIADRPAVQRGSGEWYDEEKHPELLIRTE
ncbi:glutathione S-transferase [Aspergillus heteromorphus CBS 117.55]|uniref:Glutathione S-transferase n=1 Tax=Aspergillus heteromorphus CBS 117.55 TaxID=1448321 RepID=A0A317V9C6_9EURO|nr:glutathione S-transferase [Aspergillus heteromorphus CBS 117.55]PWY70993.1 glutathione S-transferase [Aspergillus heteromorphus CBS 117.55]